MHLNKIKKIYVLCFILMGIFLSMTFSQQVQASRSVPKIAKAVAYDQNIKVSEDSKIDIVLKAIGPNDIVLVYGISNRPSYGKLSEVKGNVVTYVPYRDYYGSDKFRFEVYSKEITVRSNYATITIDVTPMPDKPTAQNIEVITLQNTPVEIDLVGYDPDGNDLKYNIIDQPKSGKLMLIDETYSIYQYTPGTDCNGNDRFTFEAK